MGKNNIKNFSLAAFVGLFAFYNISSYKIRLGSVSSSGLVIKYSKRGIAAEPISCPPVKTKIDKVTADSLATRDCAHHIESKELENGDVEYTVTSYYKGHISTGTKVFPAQEAAAIPGHNTDFIKSIVRASKKKFDEADTTTVDVDLANADAPKPDEEEPAQDKEDKDKTDGEDTTQVQDSRPALNVAGSSNDKDKDKDSDDEQEQNFDSEELMESIEDYAELKIRYNSCSGMEKSEERKLKKLIHRYDRGIKSYLRLAEKYEDSEREKNPLTRYVTKYKEKFSAFMKEVADFDSESSDFDEDEEEAKTTTAKSSKAERFECLVKRSKSIKDKKAQYEHYSRNLQPMLRERAQSGSIQEFNTFMQEVQNSPINNLAQSNPYINASIRSDLYGAQTRVRLVDNTKRIAEAQKLSEPVRTNQLRILNEERTKIKNDFELALTDVAKNSPSEMGQSFTQTAQFWANQIQPLDQLAAQALNGTADTINASAPANNQNSKDKVIEELNRLYKRIADSKAGTGNARGYKPSRVGNYNMETGQYRGDSVPQVGDEVRSIDN